MLDDETDYAYDVAGWLEDYLDELEIKERYADIQQICEKMLTVFDWKEVSPDDFKIRFVFSLLFQHKSEEAFAYSSKWYEQNKDNQNAVQALIRSKIERKDMDGASN